MILLAGQTQGQSQGHGHGQNQIGIHDEHSVSSQQNLSQQHNSPKQQGATAQTTGQTEAIPFTHLLSSPNEQPTQQRGSQHIVQSTDSGYEVINKHEVVPMSHGLILAGILFAVGLCGVMVRRNLLFMLMSLEVMMNSAALAFVVAGSRWVNPDGQVMFIFILTLAAAEAAIGLAILLQFYHRRGHLDVDTANDMRG